MTFTTMNLTGERVLVRGTDVTGREGETVLDAAEWNHVKQHRAVAEAGAAFDTSVEKFFAPLFEAVEKFETAQVKADDPIAKFVIHEGTPSVQGQDEVAIRLGHDSIVLRLIERGDTDRLVWVGDSLEVLEVLPGTSTGDAAEPTGPEPHEFPGVPEQGGSPEDYTNES